MRRIARDSCLALVLILGAPAVSAQAAAVDPAAADPAAAAPASPPASDAVDAALVTSQLATLRSIEAKLASASSLTDEERALPATLLHGGADGSVRALAAAVLAWHHEPNTASPLLVRAMTDSDERVRTTAIGSLVALSRRLDEGKRQEVLRAGLVALDDENDEVACAAAELLQAAAPASSAEALRVRSTGISDVRYGCFARIGGLPPRAVELPELARQPDAPKDAPPSDAPPSDAPPSDAPPADLAPPADPAGVASAADGTWLFVAVAASAGAVAGGAVPAALVRSRDVLTYARDRSRLVHEEVAFGSQVAGAVLGGVAAGGGAFGLSQLKAPAMDPAISAALATGGGMLVGASAQLAFGLEDSAAVLAFAAGTTGGLLAGSAFALLSEPTFADHALALAAAGNGALVTALVVFAAVPVGYDTIGGALRTDFALGVTGIGASALGLAGLTAGLFVDVPVERLVAVTAGGLLGAGALGGGAFLFIPNTIDVKSRIASGIGLGGWLIGATACGLFLPDSLFEGAPVAGAAVSLDLDAARSSSGRVVGLGVPVLAPIVSPEGAGIAASLVAGRF